MATYKEIQGYTVQSLASDPSATGVFKVIVDETITTS
jgi:hypothetical protein